MVYYHISLRNEADKFSIEVFLCPTIESAPEICGLICKSFYINVRNFYAFFNVSQRTLFTFNDWLFWKFVFPRSSSRNGECFPNINYKYNHARKRNPVRWNNCSGTRWTITSLTRFHSISAAPRGVINLPITTFRSPTWLIYRRVTEKFRIFIGQRRVAAIWSCTH